MISWWQKHMLPCAYKYFFGIDCPICGAQRSFILLLQGDFAESFKMYPPLLFLLILICLVVAYLIFPAVIKLIYLKRYSTFILIMISINYVFKIITHNV
jgi:Protein of unknown function (DUF2752)